MNPYMALARWLGRKALKAEWKSQGRNPQYADAGDVAAYFLQHREELIRAAWDHPVAQQYRQREQMKLAKKAVIAEIGGAVAAWPLGADAETPAGDANHPHWYLW
jgi:hypothetical protein